MNTGNTYGLANWTFTATYLQGKRSYCPFRYPGQYEDEETGLYYNRFRYYSPNEGMYTQQDPIGLAGNNPMLYGYVVDPLTWIDEFGLSSKLVSDAVNSLLKGKLEIFVKSRYDAEQILYQMQLAKGYTSSSGFDPSSAKNWFWKNTMLEKELESVDREWFILADLI